MMVITSALRVGHAELSHDLVGVVLVARSLLLGIAQVGRGAAVGVGIQQLPTVDLQLARLDVGMRLPDALHSTHLKTVQDLTVPHVVEVLSSLCLAG